MACFIFTKVCHVLWIFIYCSICMTVRTLIFLMALWLVISYEKMLSSVHKAFAAYWQLPEYISDCCLPNLMSQNGNSMQWLHRQCNTTPYGCSWVVLGKRKTGVIFWKQASRTPPPPFPPCVLVFINAYLLAISILSMWLEEMKDEPLS